MIQFLSPDVVSTNMLPPEESAHCCRVLRLREDDTIQVVDGKGNVFSCIITAANPKGVSVEIVGVESRPRPWWMDITLAVAPTKNIDRIEWLLEKAVEIGVGRFIPVLCERNERKIVKTERLRKIADSATKQSLKAWSTQVDDLTPLPELFKSFSSRPEPPQRYFGYCSPECERLRFVDCYNPEAPAVILIGPEGDFSPHEVEEAFKSGFSPVTFGDNRLRTETAALYGLQATHIIRDLSVH